MIGIAGTAFAGLMERTLAAMVMEFWIEIRDRDLDLYAMP
jgi:hypothetical protein